MASQVMHSFLDETLEHLERLLQVLGPKHDSDVSSSLLLGVAALRLGRYREPLHKYLQTPLVYNFVNSVTN